MKKLVSLLLVLVMALSLCACGAKEEEAPAPAPTEAPAVEAPVEEESAEEAPAEEAPVEEPAEELVVDTCILKEADDKMLNTYSVIAVNPEAPFEDADKNPVPDVAINTAGAAAFYQWLVSQEALDMAGAYGVEEYGSNLFYVKEDAPVYEGEIAEATEETKLIRLSTTTSVNDSGLLGKLIPVFEETYGYEVEVYSAGTGKSIANAKMGNADLILVHSKSQEEAFIEAGFACVVDGFEAERTSFIYNYYVLCGPSADPAGAAEAESVMAAFAAIAEGEHTFISRGDASGTHTKEISLWPEELGITAEAESFADYTEWYVSANTGMGACLVMAEEMEGYILTDKATFLTFVKNDGVM
ncbi:MAG: substrate-binding domain-containing protein [Oscillospiraceae bacterium]|nr:substrate-binding domain-containing protein [Oscillospiraceae bacterium]